MKHSLKLFTISLLLAAFFLACETNDEISAPSIKNVEIGANNSKIGHVGADLHIEAEIIAQGKIANIRLLIHQETEEEDASAQKINTGIKHSDEWQLDSTYTGVYANIKNTTFHEHVDIPSNAPIGTYHLHIYVTDLEGNQTMTEEEFSVTAPIADGSIPKITISSAPTENQLYTSGNIITITGTITDVQGLSGVYIGLIKSDAELDDASVNATNSITLLHNHDFENPTSYSFSAHISVGAPEDNNITPKAITWTAGNYYILIKAPGVDGEVGFSPHYPVKIQ